MGGIADGAEVAAAVDPPICEKWMPVSAPQAAERFIHFAFADPAAPAVATRLPEIAGLAVARTFVRRPAEFAEAPQPHPVTSGVWAVLDSTPAPYARPLAQLRFGLHAIDEVASGPAVAAPAPEPAQGGPLPGLPAMPVESMPSAGALEPAAAPPAPALRLPSIRCITAQVLPQAHFVAGPAPDAVESLPSAGGFAAKARRPRLELRLPTLARLQPADDPTDDALAAPVAAPGPAPVESMPSFPAFAAAPRPSELRIVARGRVPALRVGFGYPDVPLPAPAAAEPAAAALQPAFFEPLSRIAAQPAGTQPERPEPAMPRPGAISLEYYSQRIASAPAKPIAPIEPSVDLVYQPFGMRPARGRFEDLLHKKPRIHPFEEILAKINPNGDASGRVKVTLFGKIAATIMVGLALWAGSRVANLSQHTADLRAEVAASERTVTVADARPADYGKGPIGKMRRAIADRAATEITDTFHSGMAAWGAQPKTFAAGWKKHPEGYVSIGEMALFQPSLQYTDYRMEFYGEIEGKSMNWVVRARDRKNYYAMQFKVIEPGLRPIIAMAHYGVVNGKRGRIAETPLSVMVHNNQPYHVAVEVRGNRFTASIEGETVESWTDDAAPQGGVGFFAEAGDKARLYWMRLSRNQDWLGRVCAYLSGDGRSRQQTAELWTPEPPSRNPEPAHPRGADPAVVAMRGFDDWNSPLRAKTGKQRRAEGWIS